MCFLLLPPSFKSKVKLSHKFIHLAFPNQILILVLLPFNCIHKVILSKRNEREKPGNKTVHFYRARRDPGGDRVFFELNKVFIENNCKTITKTHTPCSCWSFHSTDCRTLEETLRNPSAPWGRVQK